MGDFGALLPTAEERALNKRLRAEHLAYLAENPGWRPSSVRRLPTGMVRFFNRLAARAPMTAPLGWIQGTTQADEVERERIAGLADEAERAAAEHQLARAVHFRCYRPGVPPSPPGADDPT